MKSIYDKVYTDTSQIGPDLSEGPVHFYDCKFTGLDLTKLRFDRCVFDRCNFDECKLGSFAEAEFYTVSFIRTDFRKADISWAYTINCTMEKPLFVGCRVTIDCDFMSGVLSKRELDGWRLIKWAMLYITPAQIKLWEFIPKRFHYILTEQDRLGALRVRRTPF